MSLGWVVAGTFGQLIIGVILFMFVIFSGGGFANDQSLGKFHLGVLNFSIFALPCISVMSAAIVIYLYINDGSAVSYWWHCAPVVAVAVYLFYILFIIE